MIMLRKYKPGSVIHQYHNFCSTVSLWGEYSWSGFSLKHLFADRDVRPCYKKKPETTIIIISQWKSFFCLLNQIISWIKSCSSQIVVFSCLSHVFDPEPVTFIIVSINIADRQFVLSPSFFFCLIWRRSLNFKI